MPSWIYIKVNGEQFTVGTMIRIMSLLCIAVAVGNAANTAIFSGASAMAFTRTIIEFGPRTPGSAGHKRAEQFITARAKSFGCMVEQDAWTATTTAGSLPMVNLIARTAAPAKQGPIIVISGHYDTKILGRNFVGANDGGSSAGFLLEMSRILCAQQPSIPVWLVWFDGEESIQEQWSAEDSLWGSRRLAARWRTDGTAARIRALINVDMIGDRDLQLIEDWNSTAWLRRLVWDTAAELGYAKHFARTQSAIEDDHMPFIRIGVPAVDLIDFDYGLFNSWWHTDRDTVDKLSADSFAVVGKVVLRTVDKLIRNKVP